MKILKFEPALVLGFLLALQGALIGETFNPQVDLSKQLGPLNLVAVASSNSTFYLAFSEEPTSSTIKFARSRDGGQTFDKVMALGERRGPLAEIKIIAADERVYVGARTVSGDAIQVCRSHDQGDEFQCLLLPPWTGSRRFFMALSGTTIYIAREYLESSGVRVFLYSLEDEGSSVRMSDVTEGQYRPRTLLDLQVSGNDIFLLWSESDEPARVILRHGTYQ